MQFENVQLINTSKSTSKMVKEYNTSALKNQLVQFLKT